MTGGSPGAIVKARGGQPDWRVMESVLAGGRHELIDRDELLARQTGDTAQAGQKAAKTNERTSATARSGSVLELRQAGSSPGCRRRPEDLPRVRGDLGARVVSRSR